MRRLDYSSGTTDQDSSTTPEKLMKSIEEITLDDSDEKPPLKGEAKATLQEEDPTRMETDPPKEEAKEDKIGTAEDKEEAMAVDKIETHEDPKSILDQKREEHHALLRQTDEYIDDIKREKLLQESVLTEDEIDRILANNSDDDEELEIKGYEIGLTLKTENLDKLRNDVMCHIFDLEEKVGTWAKPGQDVTKRPNYADNMRKLQQLNARFKGLERVNAEHKETLKLVKAARTETETVTPPSSRSLTSFTSTPKPLRKNQVRRLEKKVKNEKTRARRESLQLTRMKPPLIRKSTATIADADANRTHPMLDQGNIFNNLTSKSLHSCKCTMLVVIKIHTPHTQITYTLNTISVLDTVLRLRENTQLLSTHFKNNFRSWRRK